MAAIAPFFLHYFGIHVHEQERSLLSGHFNRGALNFNHFAPRFALSMYAHSELCY